MKMKKLFTALTVIVTAGCASGTKNEEFKSGIEDCAKMCKANPEVKEFSQKAGGGFAILFFGSEEKSCSCSR